MEREVVFSGELSKESIGCLNKFDTKRTVLFFIIFLVSVAALAISVAMLTEEQSSIMFAVYIVITIVAGIVVLCGFSICLLFEGSNFEWPFYKACYFDNQTVTISEWGVENCAVYNPPVGFTTQLPNVFFKHKFIKKVVEKEDLYIIVAGCFFKKTIVCQKNLLTRGTLAGFEDLFEGKLIRVK